MAAQLDRRRLGDLDVRVVASDRADGDFHPIRVPPGDLAGRQSDLVGRRIPMLDQRHGVDVVDLGAATGWPLCGIGDVMVAPPRSGTRIAVWAADCAPIVLIGHGGTIVGAHGGWRGLASGIVDAAVAACTSRGERIVGAVIGPLIHACCYEFGDDELRHVADGVRTAPEALRSRSRGGRPALDVPAAIAAALHGHGVSIDSMGPCTGCDDRWFSHRARSEGGRHVVVAEARDARKSTA